MGRLKQLYRAHTKKTHPDLAGGSSEDFLMLREDYEEALSILWNRASIESQDLATEQPNGMDVREELMRYLYLYSVRFCGSDSVITLIRILELSVRYKASVHRLSRFYYRSIFADFHSCRHDGDVYYTHNLFVAAIKQLIYYYSYSLERHRRRLFVYLEDLRKRSKRLDSKRAKILCGLADRLEQEVAEERIHILGI